MTGSVAMLLLAEVEGSGVFSEEAQVSGADEAAGAGEVSVSLGGIVAIVYDMV